MEREQRCRLCHKEPVAKAGSADFTVKYWLWSDRACPLLLESRRWRGLSLRGLHGQEPLRAKTDCDDPQRAGVRPAMGIPRRGITRRGT
jgi:hypothetical protein